MRAVSASSWKMVALLAEGVDRNSHKVDVLPEQLASPSSRRAWIEIKALVISMLITPVALLAEGVDRNLGQLCASILDARRPPRGGRG